MRECVNILLPVLRAKLLQPEIHWVKMKTNKNALACPARDSERFHNLAKSSHTLSVRESFEHMINILPSFMCNTCIRILNQ